MPRGVYERAPKATCKEDDCSRPVYGRSWCHMHWQRWWRYGDPNTVKLVKAPPGTWTGVDCREDQCSRPVAGLGWCSMHWERVHKHGDPQTVLTSGGPREMPEGADSSGWKADRIGYSGSHMRTRKERGPATEHRCIDCGGEAAEWSLRRSPTGVVKYAERTWPDGRTGEVPFSTDPNDYEPRCVSCHRRYDRRAAA